jgi:N-acetyl-gamma-glutamyl-phosphate reductase
MKIGVVGASGYAGGELLRIISTHPAFTIEAVSAHSNAGELITSLAVRNSLLTSCPHVI